MFSLLIFAGFVAYAYRSRDGLAAGNGSKAAGGEAAGAAEQEAGKGEQTGGPSAGFEKCPPEQECPVTFGPIIADAAIPIAKGKFAIQPTWGVFFVTTCLFSQLAPGISRGQLCQFQSIGQAILRVVG